MTPRTVDPTRIDIQFDPTQRRMRGHTVHGNHHFDVPYISQITESLWVGGCEHGLVLPSHIDHVVSLYRWERYKVKHELKSFLEITMYDAEGGVDRQQVIATAIWVNECRRTGETLVHCQAGLNRSNLIAATALILEGMSPDGAIAALRAKRSDAVLCNRSFEAFLKTLP